MSNRTRVTQNLVPTLAAALAYAAGSSSPGQAFTYPIPGFAKDKPACFAVAAQLFDIRLDTATIMRDPALAAGAKADTFGWTPERVVAAFNEEIAALVARVPGAAAAFGPQCLSRMSLVRANLLVSSWSTAIRCATRRSVGQRRGASTRLTCTNSGAAPTVARPSFHPKQWPGSPSTASRLISVARWRAWSGSSETPFVR